MTLRALHLTVGFVGIVAFLLTGVLMRVHEPPLSTMDSGIRMLYRSRHIYLLLASLLNLGIGVYYQPRDGTKRRRLQQCGSLLLLAGPILMLIAFFVESAQPTVTATFTANAVKCLLAGTLLHAAAGLKRSTHVRG
jgi:hypothetical protein